MPQPIVMPSMGMYTEEGVLTAWLRPAGTRVEQGEPVAEITTEKVTFEIPASMAGILHHAAEVGATLRVEQLLGYILTDGEVLASQVDAIITASNTERADGDSTGALSRASSSGEGSLRASPAARRLARQHGIGLHEVKGSGPGGRIVEADILAEAARRGARQNAPTAINPPEED